MASNKAAVSNDVRVHKFQTDDSGIGKEDDSSSEFEDSYVSRASSVHYVSQRAKYANLILQEVDASANFAAPGAPSEMASIEERSWSMPYLKKRFTIPSELEDLYKRYEQRFQVGTFSAYLTFQSAGCILFIAWLALQCLAEDTCNPMDVPPQLASIVGFSVLLALSLSMMLVIYNDNLFKEKPWVLYVLSGIMAFSIEAIDVTVVLWSNHQGRHPLRGALLTPLVQVSSVPILSLLNHLVIYFFLPIAKKRLAFLYGCLSSCVCLGLFLGIETSAQEKEKLNSTQIATQAIADCVFYASLNAAGVYLRYVNEINMRRGFLDKRSCIETTFKLKYEKEQEENLLLSIIPKHMARKVRDSIWSHLEKMKNRDSDRAPFNELFLERHENISILFADICKFTEMTTTLPVDKLVETLNDLFGKFDDAADMHKCMRIKILGDCYYCVSGVPNADPLHAANCVNMGLKMIELIKDVRQEHGVPVNMRIGIHSGYIFSGVIGSKKWHFDIWSKDVTIANRMESTGQAGAVHITATTKAYLQDAFFCVPAAASMDHDEVLNGIPTYLIWPEDNQPDTKACCWQDAQNKLCPSFAEDDDEEEEEEAAASATKEEQRQQQAWRNGASSSASTLATTSKVAAAAEDNEQRLEASMTPTTTAASKKRRHSVLMDTSVKNFQKLLNSAEEFMRDEVENLPLRTYDQWLHPEEINPLFLWFKDKSWEAPYCFEDDLLYKFYIMASFVMLNAIGIILLLTQQHPNLNLWAAYTVLFVLLALMIPCLWVAYIWDQIIDPHYESDNIAVPQNRLLRYCYTASKRITTQFWLRTPIFVIVSLLFVVTAVIDVATISCLQESPKNYTYRCALAMVVIFAFLRIYHWLKIIITTACLAFYALLITDNLGASKEDNIFQHEYFGLNGIVHDEALSHVIFLVVVALLFWLMDRQYEYLRRLDYQWKRQLKSEQLQASITKLVNRALLQNILPLHVAEHYLSSNRETGELYSETYEKVAVLFASMPDFMASFRDDRDLQVGLQCLKTLNDIIRSLDMLLFEDEFCRVEKIKVISSTYMAACGLQPGRKNSLEPSSSSLLPSSVSVNVNAMAASGEDSTSSRSSSVQEPFSRGDNATVMAKFAAAMMRTIKSSQKKTSCSTQEQESSTAEAFFQMRIGFNVGPVIAGVVGAQKPLYDIWGDTVNVASRMDYTGVKGYIQVPEATAECLRGERISCTFRDTIAVKGKGQMRTYYVDLTQDQYIIVGQPPEATFQIGSEDSSSSDCENDQQQNGRFIVTPAIERRARTDGGDESSSSSSCGSDNELVMVVEAELHNTARTTESSRATEDQVLSFLDHVLANEDDEREANEQSNSIKKKDSGYGSQGHLKLEINAIAAAVAAGELPTATQTEEEEEEDEFPAAQNEVDEETAARFYDYLHKEDTKR